MARELQGDGAPVVITYPGMVWGPHDPHLGEAAAFARSVLRGLVPMVPPGELPVVDVRDVATAHVAALSPGHGPRRYMLAGGTVSLADLIRVIRRLTGRRLVTVTAPTSIVRSACPSTSVVCGLPSTEVRPMHRRQSATSACASERRRTRWRTCFGGCMPPAT